MRAKEFLLELREYMDRTKYGCWIDALTKEIHYVPDKAHNEVILNIAAERGESDAIGHRGYYYWGFDNHFVRVEHDKRTDIYIEGNNKDIKRISHILLASCAQPEIEKVIVEMPNIRASKEFNIPDRRRDLIMFIKGETE